MTCDACTKAREGYTLHCPACIYCGARLIQHILKLPRPLAERKERARTTLDVWTKHNHSEAQLRSLAKSASVPFTPLKEAAKRGG